MNLYLFNDNDSAAIYGIGTYLKELAHALESVAVNVHIVHLHSDRPKFEIVKSKRIEYWYIPEIRNNNTFSGSIQKVEDYFRNVIYLFRLHIKDTNNLIFHFNYNQCQALAKGLKELFECKTITTVHFIKWEFELHGNLFRYHTLKSKPKNQMNSFEQSLYTTDEYESLLYKEVDRVIALSHYTQHILETEYQIDIGKISIIPNGLEDTNSIQVSNRNSLRRKWHISENELIILFAGRLQPVKGLIFLIKAFFKVLEEIPNCRLMVAGSGNYNTHLQAAKDICTKIAFTGLLEKEELYEMYQIADIGVIPSLYEPFGYVALEMMMHELPIVATATSGLNEVVDESCGLKIPLTVQSDMVEIDTNLLAEKILYLLQHPTEAKKMGQNGRKRYLKEYSSEVFRRNMLELYESLFEINTKF